MHNSDLTVSTIVKILSRPSYFIQLKQLLSFKMSFSFGKSVF